MRLTSFLPQCLLALVLFVHGVAQALPTYHVTVDTASHAGQGLMDFTFLANAGATPATAVLSNFSGAFGTVYDNSAGVTGAIPGQLILGNQNGGDYLTHLTQIVGLGGSFSFDIRFDGEFANVASLDESLFNVTLYNEDFSGYIGTAGSLVSFELVPLVNGEPGGVVASSSSPMATVAEVPEPSTLLLSLTALPFCVSLARRRRPACEARRWRIG
jgi:hypothetical protein